MPHLFIPSGHVIFSVLFGYVFAVFPTIVASVAYSRDRAFEE